METTSELGSARRAKRRFLLALFSVALIGFCARAWFATVVVPETSLPADPYTYHLMGTNMADGLGYVRPAEINLPEAALTPTSEFPPGLPAIVAVSTKLGARTPERQALLTSLVGAGTVVLIGFAGRRIGGVAVGLVAAGIVALHPLIVQPDAILMSEGPYIFGVSAVLLAAFAAWDHPEKWWRWCVFGGVIGLTAMVRAEALLFAPLLILPLAVVRRRDVRRALASIAVGGAALLLIVGPWMIRNAVTFNRFVPIGSNSGVVVLGANCPEVYSGREIGSWSFGCVAITASLEPEKSLISREGLSEVDVYNNWMDAGLRYLGFNSTDLVKVVPVRILRTAGLWNPAAQLDFDTAEGRNRTAQVAGFFVHWLLLPFAVGGAFVAWRRGRGLASIVLVPVAIAVIDSGILYGSTKMRATAEPSLALFAALGLVAGVVALKDRRSRAQQSSFAVDSPAAPRHLGRLAKP